MVLENPKETVHMGPEKNEPDEGVIVEDQGTKRESFGLARQREGNIHGCP